MKYWFLNIEIRNGEYEYNSLSLHTGKFNAEEYVKGFYNDDGEESDNGEYYFNGGEVACSIKKLKEITKKEYDVLRKFI